MAKIKTLLVATATVAAIGAASLPAAQARDNGGAIVAGVVIGAVVGGLLAQHVHAAPAPRPVIVAPPPQVVYQPRVVYPPHVVYEQRPVVVYHQPPVYPQRPVVVYQPPVYEQRGYEPGYGRQGHEYRPEYRGQVTYSGPNAPVYVERSRRHHY